MAYSISHYRQVASTELQLPVLGFGSAHLGEMYASVDEADSRATLQAAWDAGIRYYDTAAWYGRGLAEHRLGGFLRTQPSGSYQITTKVGRTLFRPADPANFDRHPWRGGLNFEVRFDYSYDGIMRSYQQALQRLALDSVDALLIHDLDASVLPAEAVPGHQKVLAESGLNALEELKRNGDIKAYGMGINTLQALKYATVEYSLDFLLVAMPYTLLDQAALHSGMADCLRKGSSVIIGAPLASGILATGSGSDGKYNYRAAPVEIQSKVKGLEAICQAHKVALPAAALQFPLAHPAVCSIIPGAVSARQIQQIVQWLQADIPVQLWHDLKNEKLIDIESPTPAPA